MSHERADSRHTITGESRMDGVYHALDHEPLPRIDEKPSGRRATKAIVIANALLEDGYSEGLAIRIAISRAREWASRRGIADPIPYGPFLH